MAGKQHRKKLHVYILLFIEYYHDHYDVFRTPMQMTCCQQCFKEYLRTPASLQLTSTISVWVSTFVVLTENGLLSGKTAADFLFKGKEKENSDCKNGEN